MPRSSYLLTPVSRLLPPAPFPALATVPVVPPFKSAASHRRVTVHPDSCLLTPVSCLLSPEP